MAEAEEGCFKSLEESKDGEAKELRRRLTVVLQDQTPNSNDLAGSEITKESGDLSQERYLGKTSSSMEPKKTMREKMIVSWEAAGIQLSAFILFPMKLKVSKGYVICPLDYLVVQRFRCSSLVEVGWIYSLTCTSTT